MEEEAHKIISNYMKASTALETYLHNNGPSRLLKNKAFIQPLKPHKHYSMGGDKELAGPKRRPPLLGL